MSDLDSLREMGVASGRNVTIHHVLDNLVGSDTVAAMKLAKDTSEAINRDVVVMGILNAIDLAKTIDDPGQMIRGWTEIGKLKGLAEPQRVVLELPENLEKRLVALRSIPTEELLRMVDKTNQPKMPEKIFEDASYEMVDPTEDIHKEGVILPTNGGGDSDGED